MGSFIILVGSFIVLLAFVSVGVSSSCIGPGEAVLALVVGISLALHEGAACIGKGFSFSCALQLINTLCFLPSVLGVMPLFIRISRVLFSSAESVPTTTVLNSLPVWVLVYQIRHIGQVQYVESTWQICLYPGSRGVGYISPCNLYGCWYHHIELSKTYYP